MNAPDSAPPPAPVRPYRTGEAGAAAALLYESSGGLYDRYAGSRALAERALRRALEREGTSASGEVVWVAESDGELAGAMAAVPFDEWAPRAQAFLATTLRSIPPWRWPGALWLYRASGRTAPEPPRSSFYVDSLAVGERWRRRGVATALLERADAEARKRGLTAVALDTWSDNRAARALYLGHGFDEVARTPARGGLPGAVSLVKQLA